MNEALTPAPKPEPRWFRPTVIALAPLFGFGAGVGSAVILWMGSDDIPVRFFALLLGVTFAMASAAGFLTVSVMKQHRSVPMWRFIVSGICMSVLMMFALGGLTVAGCGFLAM